MLCTGIIHDDRKKRIYEYIASTQYFPVKIKQLAAIIGVPAKDKREYRDIIDELIKENRIYLDRYGLIHPERESIVTGTFSQAKPGYGFVICDDGTEDVFIHESDTFSAMNGDIVKVILSGKRKKRREGIITEVIKRKITEVVGTIQKNKNFSFVVPDDIYKIKDIFIPKGKTGGAANNQKVVAHINDYGGNDGKSPSGEIISILGYADEPGVDILAIAKEAGLPDEFPYEVLEEADNMPDVISEREISQRKDIRDWITITIDGEDAKDLDDAVTLKYENNIYTLGVHIADVTHYVREDTAFNREALARGTSAYLVDRVIPMLPKKLSNGICSLNEGADRLCLSCIMQFDDDGNLLNHEIAETVINVNHRMTYSSVQKIVADNDAEERNKYSDILNMLLDMRTLAEKRIGIRKKQGAVDFDFPESKIILDSNGNPVSIKPYERNIATRIIEEFMLATNETIAEDYYWQDQPFVYRSHEAPDMAKMHELSVFISNFGYKVRFTGNDIHPMEIQKLLAGLEGVPEENLISRLVLRSMKRAKYTVTAQGHFGLATKYYCHFTSPIRRYPDLIIHRIIKENLHGKLDSARTSHYDEILPEIAERSSMLERRAELAEREVHKLKKAEYMLSHIGEVYEGIISGVTGWGIYVELPNTVEGMVRITDMTDDDYVYEDKSYRISGRYTGKEYLIGQKVMVEVLNASTETRTVDFVFVEKEE